MTSILLRVNEYVIKTHDRPAYYFPKQSALASTPFGPYTEEEEDFLYPVSAAIFYSHVKFFAKRQTLDADPLLVMMVCASPFFNALSPRISRVRPVDLRYLQVLQQSPTFCYSLELHLHLNIPKNTAAPPTLDAATRAALESNDLQETENTISQKKQLAASYRRYTHVREIQEFTLDFLQNLFPRMAQVEVLSFTYPSPSESAFFKDRVHHVRGGAGGFSSSFTHATNHLHRIPTSCSALNSSIPADATTSITPSPASPSNDDEMNNNNDNNDGDNYQEHSGSNIFQLLALIPNLRHVSFHGLRFIDSNIAAEDAPNIKNFKKLLDTPLPRQIRSLDFTSNNVSAEFLVGIIPSFSRVENIFLSPTSEWTKSASIPFFELIAKNLVTLDFGTSAVLPQEALVPLLECSKLEVLRIEKIRSMDAIFVRNLVSRMSLQGCCFRELRLGSLTSLFDGEDDDAEKKQSRATLAARNKEDDKNFLDSFATSTSDGAVDPCPLLPVLNRSAATIEVLSVSHLNLVIPDEMVLSNFPSFDRLRVLVLHNLDVNEKGAKLLGSGLKCVEVISLVRTMKEGNAIKIFMDGLLALRGNSSCSNTNRNNSDNNDDDDDDDSHFGSHFPPPPPLISLELSEINSNLGTIDFSRLRHSLEILVLSMSGITDETVESIRGFPFLKKLTLVVKENHSAISEAAVVISEFMENESTGAESNGKSPGRAATSTPCGITDRSLDVISSLPSLKILKLGNGSFTDVGMAALAKTPALTSLEFFLRTKKDDSTISEEGFRKFFTSSNIAENLEYIGFRWLPPSITTLPGVGSHLKRLECLALSYSDGIDDSLGRELAQSRSLQSITLRHCPKFTKMGLIYMMEDADEIFLKEKHIRDTEYGMDVSTSTTIESAASSSSSSSATTQSHQLPIEKPLGKLRRCHLGRCGDMLNPVRDPRIFPGYCSEKANGEGMDELLDDDYGTLCPDPKAEKSLREFPSTIALLKIRMKTWRSNLTGIFVM